ncbi:MAG: hypothetical protein DRP09_16910, partial [Candidatus Thorarchaeota archaeon]
AALEGLRKEIKKNEARMSRRDVANVGLGYHRNEYVKAKTKKENTAFGFMTEELVAKTEHHKQQMLFYKQELREIKQAETSNRELKKDLQNRLSVEKRAEKDKLKLAKKAAVEAANIQADKLAEQWKKNPNAWSPYTHESVIKARHKTAEAIKKWQAKLFVAQSPEQQKGLIALEQQRLKAIKSNSYEVGKVINKFFATMKNKLLAQIKLERASSLRQTLIGTLPGSVQEKINAADARKAFIKQMQDMGWTGRKANQALSEYDQSAEARKANKGAGQFEGIGDVWKRIQSGTMRPEVKIGQKTLAAIKDLGVTAEKQLRVLEAGQVAIAG